MIEDNYNPKESYCHNFSIEKLRVIKEDEEAFSQPIPAQIERYMRKFIDAVGRGNLNRKRKLAILGRTIVALGLDPQEVSKYARLVKREL